MLTSSGQAANFLRCSISARRGSHRVLQQHLWRNLQPHLGDHGKMGISVTFVGPSVPDEELEAASAPIPRLCLARAIANPALTVLDIERFAKAAHAHGVPLIVDNTFPTPVNCRPLEWGTDIVTPPPPQIHGRPWRSSGRRHRETGSKLIGWPMYERVRSVHPG